MEQLRLLCVAAVSLCNLPSHHHAGKQRQNVPHCSSASLIHNIFLLFVGDMREQKDLFGNT